MATRQQHAGFTLVETLAAIVIAALFSLTVGTIFLSSMRLWRECSVRDQTFPPAFVVLNTINKEVRGSAGVSVTPTQVAPSPAAKDSTIIISVPQKDAQGYDKFDPIAGLLTDYRVKYYLTTGGQLSAKQLWRVKLAATSDTTLDTPHMITDNVVSLSCSAATTASGRTLSLYTTAVTLQAHEEGLVYSKDQTQMGAQTAFRNDL